MSSRATETLSSLDFTELAKSGLTIFAQRPWTAASAVILLDDEEADPNHPKLGDFEYLLEASIVGEWVDQLTGLPPEKAAEAVIFYAENDAFPSWLSTETGTRGSQSR
ncbi:hypothetical protein [Brevundimonas sp. P7753]|uniref:hypothetical protein n=1 Tax=Brevundimonas sp. P7753 TaxID=2726982 RepID=UPI0015B99634|nr:hypothetical protein [Brevundimonas sp. P7753]NWE53348.1 hypothetical protein [Brevundimonas sp. P7753]